MTYEEAIRATTIKQAKDNYFKPIKENAVDVEYIDVVEVKEIGHDT